MVILATGVIAPALPYSHADIIPPNHQTKIGISDDDFVCDSGLFKVIRVASDSVVCVKAKHVSKLVASGWEKIVDDKPVDEELLSKVINRKSIDLATMNILETTVKSKTGTSAPGKSIANYDVVFEICASIPIYSPDINISSDSETKHYELANLIDADVCTLSPTKIKATDLEVQINSLQTSLIKEKQTLKSLIHNLDRAENFTELVNTHVVKITELRNQISMAKAEFNKIMYLTYN